jgi:hypothetical protein
MKTQQTYSFKWKTTLYRVPPIQRPQDLTVSDEELARVEEICMDAARKRIAGESCIVTEPIRSAIEIGHFLIISSPADVEEPFYIAQVQTQMCPPFALSLNSIIAHLITSINLIA